MGLAVSGQAVNRREGGRGQVGEREFYLERPPAPYSSLYRPPTSSLTVTVPLYSGFFFLREFS